MLDKDDFKARLRLFTQSNTLIETWDSVVDEITRSTYPWVELRHTRLLRCVIDVIWSTEFSVADYQEVMFRLLHFEKKLFPSEKQVLQTLSDVYDKGALNPKMSELVIFDKDDKAIKVSSMKVLEVSDKYKTECIAAMADTLQRTLTA